MKTIQVNDQTHENLKKIGLKDETFDSIIQRLLWQMSPANLEEALNRFNEYFERLRLMRNKANEEAIALNKTAYALPPEVADQYAKLRAESEELSKRVRAIDGALAALRDKLERWAW